MSNIIAIGDIHGCLDELKQLLQNCEKVEPPRKYVFIGDYVDRGPDSKGVIDLLIDLLIDFQRSHDVVCLMGNHEDLMLNDKLSWLIPFPDHDDLTM